MTAFLAGFCLDFAWLAWAYCSERQWPARTAVLSLAVGGLSLLGVGHGLRGGWDTVGLLAGYFCGSYAAVWMKGRLL